MLSGPRSSSNLTLELLSERLWKRRQPSAAKEREIHGCVAFTRMPIILKSSQSSKEIEDAESSYAILVHRRPVATRSGVEEIGDNEKSNTDVYSGASYAIMLFHCSSRLLVKGRVCVHGDLRPLNVWGKTSSVSGNRTFDPRLYYHSGNANHLKNSQ